MARPAYLELDGVTVMLSAEHVEQLREIAKRDGRSVEWLVRWIVEDYLDNDQPE